MKPNRKNIMWSVNTPMSRRCSQILMISIKMYVITEGKKRKNMSQLSQRSSADLSAGMIKAFSNYSHFNIQQCPFSFIQCLQHLFLPLHHLTSFRFKSFVRRYNRLKPEATDILSVPTGSCNAPSQMKLFSNCFWGFKQKKTNVASPRAAAALSSLKIRGRAY